MTRKIPKAIQAERERRAKAAPKARRSAVESVRAEDMPVQVRLSGVIDSYYETADKITAADSELQEAGVKAADLVINSPGGDHIEALAIFDTIQASPIDYTVKVVGNACSAAATISMAVPKDRRFIGAKARFMIHEAETYAYGRSEDLRQIAAFVDGCNTDMRRIYAEASGKDEATITAEMTATTWYQGAEAVAGGFFAATIDLSARAELDAEVLETFEHVPHEVISELNAQVTAQLETPPADQAPVVETPAVVETTPVAETAPVVAQAPVVETPPAAPAVTAMDKVRAQIDADPAIQALAKESAEQESPVVVPNAQAKANPAARPQSVRDRQAAMFHPQPTR